MSFVDGLNYAINNADKIKQEQEECYIVSLTNDFIRFMREACEKSLTSRKLSGYIYHSLDSDYAFSIFKLSEELPELDVNAMTKKANQAQHNYVVKPGLKKSRVYKSVLCFPTQEQAAFFVQQVEIKLQSLGFKQYNVVFEKIKDLYLVCDAREGFFHNSYKYSLEENGYTYVVHLDFSW